MVGCYENGKTTGDPTEGALLEFAQKYHFDTEQMKKDMPILHEQPFDSIRKRMTVVVQNDESYTCYTKGTVEEMLELCTHILVERTNY